MRKTITLLLAVLMALSLCACGQKAPTWQEQYDLGVRYLSDGNYEEAIIAFTAAIEIDPKRPEAFLGRGDAYLGGGELDAAKADYEQAIGLDEDCAEAYLGLAEFYFATGDTARAEEAQNAARAALARRGVSMEGATLPQTAWTEREDFDDGWYSISEYDSAGNCIKITHYNGGAADNWSIYEYDSAGNMLKQTIYNADGTVQMVIDYNDKTSETESTTDARPSQDNTPKEDNTKVINDFSIEGSWKSVGSYGFGQAQPGMTVTFDGTNCNFYSPFDTYEFYQENGNWRLACKNFLWQDVLYFTVTVIDDDQIEIVYDGSTSKTVLQRLS